MLVTGAQQWHRWRLRASPLHLRPSGFRHTSPVWLWPCHFLFLTGREVFGHGTPIGCVPSILMEGLLSSSAGASISQMLVVSDFSELHAYVRFQVYMSSHHLEYIWPPISARHWAMQHLPGLLAISNSTTSSRHDRRGCVRSRCRTTNCHLSVKQCCWCNSDLEEAQISELFARVCSAIANSMSFSGLAKTKMHGSGDQMVYSNPDDLEIKGGPLLSCHCHKHPRCHYLLMLWQEYCFTAGGHFCAGSPSWASRRFRRL